jgi:hypothetical protein
MRPSTKHEAEGNPSPTFADVGAILDWLVKGKTQHLKGKHQSQSFGWTDKEALLAAEVVRPTKTYRLIQPELINVGRATETNLYRALSEAGLDGWNMPWQGNDEGAYATEEELATIAAWIDLGCPD